jgi:hypothetical protein
MSNETEQREAFEAWLKTVCFQRPTPEAYDLALCAWREALLRAQQPVRWQPIDGAPIGDYWFALDCGHVVMGVKAGSRLVDWESSIDNDCCADAAATCCMPVIPPTPPQGASDEG